MLFVDILTIFVPYIFFFDSKNTMLLNNFFTITRQDKSDLSIDSQIKLNAEHPIYKGHFPHQPVLPGVCMIQILAELTGVALGKDVAIKKGSQVKFLVPIIPQKYPDLQVKISYTVAEDGSLNISGSIHAEELTFFKFKGLFSQG